MALLGATVEKSDFFWPEGLPRRDTMAHINILPQEALFISVRHLQLQPELLDTGVCPPSYDGRILEVRMWG